MRRPSLSTITATAAALLLLWGASRGMSYLALGSWSFVIALAIAAAKAILVVLFFMEIAIERTSIHATLFAGIAMIAILFTVMIADVRTRGAPPLVPPVPEATVR